MHRLAIREGWSTFFLAATLVLTATLSIQRANWADGLSILVPVALAGLATGLVLASARRIPSALAHLLALAVGSVVVLYQMTTFLDDALGGWGDKLAFLWLRWNGWIGAVVEGRRADDLYLFVLLMAVLVWTLSYITVWFVFRSGWVWPAIVLPAVILLLNLGYARDVPTLLIVVYLFAAILLLVRFNMFRHEMAWQRAGVAYPPWLGRRWLRAATIIALAVIVTGWAAPIPLQSARVRSTWDEVNGPWRALEDTFNGWFGSLRGSGSRSAGGFAGFSESFNLGGPLRLTDQPVVVVDGTEAPYLVAHRYNVFTGRGWLTDVGERFQPPQTGDPAAWTPLVPLAADQSAPAASGSMVARSQHRYDVRILDPRGSLVYSVQEFQSVSVPSRLQVSWHTYQNQLLDVQAATVESAPPDLWPLVQLLKSADFTPPEPAPDLGAGATPAAGSATGQSLGEPPELPAIRDELRRLRERGIAVGLEIDDSYRVPSITFSGQLPVYADVEAVLAESGTRTGDAYTLRALVSEATADDLRAAGTSYPVEIAERYLQLPEQVSERTRGLAQQLAVGNDNPYDIASAIEAFLRENVRYREDITAPPQGVDAVDYFLFESREGYCTYFASAMAEMLRINGIPSRLAVGFYPAPYDGNARGYLYRELNAHAWVEAYFPGYGWIPFEPTAARSPITRPEPAAVASPATGSGAPAVRSPQDMADRLLDGSESGASGQLGTAPDDGPSAVLVAGVAIAVVVLLAAAGGAVLWRRGLRRLTPGQSLFTRLQLAARWIGIRPRASMTPYEYANEVSRRIPASHSHAQTVADLYVREQYGRAAPSEDELLAGNNAWFRLRAMVVRYGLFGRWRRRHGSRR